MRGLNLIAVLLVVLGIGLAATSGSSFEKRQQRIQAQNVDLALKENPIESSWPWVVGSAAFLCGLAIFLYKSRQRR